MGAQIGGVVIDMLLGILALIVIVGGIIDAISHAVRAVWRVT